MYKLYINKMKIDMYKLYININENRYVQTVHKYK